MTATVTKLAGRHSWLVESRKDDPKRHIRTCKRDGCGLRKRSELVDGVWLELWLWPDGESGDTSGGRKVPSCRAGQAAPPHSCGSDPAPAPPSPAADGGAVPPKPAVQPVCCRCDPPCGRPGHLHLGGVMCDEAAAAVARARAKHLRELQAATSGMGVPTWGGAA